MYKTTVEYVNFDGEQVKEELCFHISEAEATILIAKYDGDIENKLKELVAKKDYLAMVLFFKELLMLSVGKRKGPLFVKDQDVKDGFEYSGAYPTMFVKLAQDEELAKAFINGILPRQNEIPKPKH